MPTVIEDIPATLRPAADAALAWINNQQGANYKLTGLVDPDTNWQPDQGTPTDMALVLCENDMCAREQVRIRKQGDGFEVSNIAAQDTLIPHHLDPPQGVRKGWIDQQLAKHSFILVVFYRGFW